MSPESSIVVCTRNRARSLERCLRALVEGGAATDATEILVVDNGSEDPTPGVVTRWEARDPRVRGVREPRLGVAIARNRGWREAQGEIVAFVDDDVEVPGGWLRTLVAALSKPGVVAVGGPIRPRFERPPPPWLTAHHVLALACLDHGPERREITEFPFLFTANLAIRREDLDHLGGFDEQLGRRGEELLSGEDTDLCERLRRAGGRLLYEPAAAVDHWIGPERLTRAYFRRRDFGTGRTRARQTRGRARAGMLAVGKMARLPIHGALWLIARLRGDAPGAAERSRSVWATLGFVAECARTGRSGRIA